MRLKDKTAIITGASRGIGKAIALALAKEGASVVIAARSETEGRLSGTIYQTVEEIRALGGNALAIRTDVTSEENINDTVQRTLEHYQHIDILVNNAGIGVPGNIVEVSAKRWDLIMGVNLKGTFLCTKAVLPYMMKQGSGSIINLSSILGTRVISSGVPYGVTKAAIERFTKGVAREVSEYNIAVNALCPAYTDTEGLRIANPDKARASLQKVEMWGSYALFLACQDASSLTGKCLTARELEKLVSKGL
ncbi:SDR family NAD(P)-dependent oxidoreductase [Chloroflexota bacterium]